MHIICAPIDMLVIVKSVQDLNTTINLSLIITNI